MIGSIILYSILLVGGGVLGYYVTDFVLAIIRYKKK